MLITYVRAITNNIELHKKIAKYTFPLWLYVTITGVVVYLMISPLLFIMKKIITFNISFISNY